MSLCSVCGMNLSMYKGMYINTHLITMQLKTLVLNSVLLHDEEFYNINSLGYFFKHFSLLVLSSKYIFLK